MLEVGNGKLTLDENRTHMSLWAMLAAPLIAGNNLTQMTPDIGAILMNKDVIAIDQDTIGRQGDRIYAEGPIEIWAKPLKGAPGHQAAALAIFNFGETANEMRGISLHLKEAGITGPLTAHDVWGATDLGPITDTTKFSVPRHGVVLLLLK
jgi:alpha-galactosidase